MKKNEKTLRAMLVFLAIGLMAILLTSCGTTNGCGRSYVKNYNKCPVYHLNTYHLYEIGRSVYKTK
jgi:predicted small secreted protein